jgi:cell division topological specificity factor
VFDFFNRLFGAKPSSATAKERLRLVLLSDHLSLAPDVVEALKNDLIEVISRYCEVDAANCDVTFERQDKQIAMLANIPILGMQRPKPPAPPPPPAAAPPAQPGLPDGTAAGAVLATATPSAPSAPAPASAAKPQGKTSGTNGRRRRRKHGVQGAPRPQPT